MARRFLIRLICLSAVWAGCIESATAQAPPKMVRATYAVADLVVPATGVVPADHREQLANTLMGVIQGTVAPDSWKDAGGAGTIQFFPLGMAIVVYQRVDVHADLARLLADLRRHADVQVCVATRLVHVSASMAKHLRLDMNEHGKSMPGTTAVKGAVSMDDKQIAALLKSAQTDESYHIMQTPKVTLFNAQHALLSCMKLDKRDGMSADITPVLTGDKSLVRLALNLQMYTPADPRPQVIKAANTFTLAPGHTLVWSLGATTANREVFVLATPRVISVEEEPKLLPASVGARSPLPRILDRDSGEEQSIPEPKKLGSPKERAIEYRLKQPISLNFRKTSLRDAIITIAITSGVQVVPDMRAMREARIDLDAPLSGSCDNVTMMNALTILLKPMRLTYVIEDDVLKITTESRTTSKVYEKRYQVGDIVELLPTVEGEKPRRSMECDFLELIKTVIARDSWEDRGGPGNVQYHSAKKMLVVMQCQEIHEEVELLLATLRKLHGPPVNVAVRFVHASADSADRLRKEMANIGKVVEAYQTCRPATEPREPIDNFTPTLRGAKEIPLTTSKGAPQFISLAPGDVQRLLDCVPAESIRTVAAPRMKFGSGQRLAMQCLQKQTEVTEFRVPGDNPIVVAEARTTKPAILQHQEKVTGGWRYEVQPIVAADRRSVRLKLDFEHSAREDAVERLTKAAGTFVVEDGRTLVWNLGETAGRQHLFVLITPRIVVRQADEEPVELPGTIPPLPRD